MLDFWPLNMQYEGKNLMSNGGNFTLTNVQYNGDDGRWKSPPAYFPSNGKGYFSSSEFHFEKQDFSWMAAYKQEATVMGAAFAFPLSFGAFDMTYMVNEIDIRIYGGGFKVVRLKVNEWHTLALVATGSTMTFYADGQIVGRWTYYRTVSSIKVNYEE